MVVQELGWDNDTDDELRVAIEDAIDADMVDGDYGNVVDAVAALVARRGRRPRRRAGRRAHRPGRRRRDLAAHPEGRAARTPSTPPTSPRRRRSRASPRPRPPRSARTGRPPAWSRPRPGLTRSGLTPARRAPLDREDSPRVPAGDGAQGARPSPGSSGPTRRASWRGWSGPLPSGAPARPAASRRWPCAAPDRVGLVDELGELTFGEMHRRSRTRWPARCASTGVEEGDARRGDVPQPPRLRRRHRSRPPSSAPTSSTSTPPSPGRSWSRCSSARARSS